MLPPSFVKGSQPVSWPPKKFLNLIFAEVKTRSDLGRALNQAEKGLIQHYIENDHPLLNQKLMADHFDEITPKGEVIDLVNEEIWVYSTQSTR